MQWGQRGSAAGALLFYALLGLWWTYPLVFHAGTHIATPLDRTPSPDKRPLARAAYNDQLLTISGLARNAAALVRGDPAGVYSHRVCHPTPGASFLGEHMIESAILGLPAYALTRNPLAAYNLAVLLSTLAAAMSMYYLVRYWTGSSIAAFVSGLLFAFHPARLDNLTHLAVVGVHWIPLVLLCFERLLDDPRPHRAAILSAVATLQALTGSYPLLVLACFAGPYGLVRLLNNRSSARRVLVYLALAVVVCVVAVSLILAPYVVQQRAWDVLRLRWTILAGYADFLPGQRFATGLLILPLAASAALRGARRWASPALATAVGAFLCLLVCSGGPLWPGGPVLPPMYVWLSGHFEFLAFIRAPVSMRSGFYMGLAILAGLGLAGLLASLRQERRVLVGILVTGALLVEIFNPWVTAGIYTRTRQVSVKSAAPSADILEAYAALDERKLDGPVLDLPYTSHASGQLEEMPLYMHASTYFPDRPTAACYNSYNAPSHFDVARMAGLLPSDRAISELAGAGFRNLVLHRYGGAEGGESLVRTLAVHRDMRTVSDAGSIAVFRNVRDVKTQSDLTTLRFEELRLPTSLRVGLHLAAVDLVVRNASSDVWALPRPIKPLSTSLRFVDEASGVATDWFEPRVLPPLSLAAGQTAAVPIVLSKLPQPGSYKVDVKIPALGWNLSSEMTVLVLPSERVTYGAPW